MSRVLYTVVYMYEYVMRWRICACACLGARVIVFMCGVARTVCNNILMRELHTRVYIIYSEVIELSVQLLLDEHVL